MTKRRAEGLLAAIVIARSTSLLFARVGLESLAPLTLLGLRFCLAFAALAPFLARRLRRADRRTLLGGLALGAAFSAVMTAEIFALRATDASTTSFLENTAIVLVPLLEAALRRRAPGREGLLRAAVALAGVALLTLRRGAGLDGGALLCLLAALLYAGAILLTDRLSRQGDALCMGLLQLGFMGLFTGLGAFAFETPRLPAGGREWAVLLALALFCSCFGFALQPVAQRHTDAGAAARLCALNPLSTAVLSAVFLGERLGPAGLLGAALVLLGVGPWRLRPPGRRRYRTG